jgi:DNA replicative helicase MCM subunit Mcm2 (Cdc46/Mcm family)
MLSRFDVIFVLLDRPDELMDQALSEHIMALHSGESTAAARLCNAVNDRWWQLLDKICYISTPSASTAWACTTVSQQQR